MLPIQMKPINKNNDKTNTKQKRGICLVAKQKEYVKIEKLCAQEKKKVVFTLTNVCIKIRVERF